MEIAESKKDLGNEAYKNGDFLTAILLYKESASMLEDLHLEVANEKLTILYANIAAASLSLKQYPETVEFAQKCLALNPTYIKAHLRLANAYFLMDELEKALEVVNKGLKVARDSESSTSTINQKAASTGVPELKRLLSQIRQKMDAALDQEVKTPAERPGRKLNEQDLKAIEELQNSLQDNLIKGQKARKEKSKNEMIAKRTALTMQQVDSLEAPISYLAVGRMFSKTDFTRVKETLTKEHKDAVEASSKMKKVEEFFDSKIRGIETSIREIVQGS